MRPRPNRIEALPKQYFTSLLARVAAVAAEPGEPLIDLGRGNPDVPPPAHVVEALVETAREQTSAVHGYAPFAGLPELREAIATRYAEVYGVELDPHREVAVVPGTKTALIEVALCIAAPGRRDRAAGSRLPGLQLCGRPRRGGANAVAARRGRAARMGRAHEKAGARLPQLPVESDRGGSARPASSPRPSPSPTGRTGPSCTTSRTAISSSTAAAPQSFLAEPGAREVGVELFSLSKSYGMAGWRLGFVLGNEELVARVTWLQEHVRAGIFVALQRAAIAALTGPQETVAERRALYEARRDRVVAALPTLSPRCEGTFFVWLQLPDDWSCERLLEEARVALAPGEGFGARGSGHARLSLAVPDETLDAGLARLRQALSRE